MLLKPLTVSVIVVPETPLSLHELLIPSEVLLNEVPRGLFSQIRRTLVELGSELGLGLRLGFQLGLGLGLRLGLELGFVFGLSSGLGQG